MPVAGTRTRPQPPPFPTLSHFLIDRVARVSIYLAIYHVPDEPSRRKASVGRHPEVLGLLLSSVIFTHTISSRVLPIIFNPNY